LILLLADSYLATSRPAEAIAVLEPAFQEQPERDDLRARLAAAYSRAGRKPEAASLEAKQGSGSTIDAVTARPL
jgi:predicted Zn-dependent protease